MGDQQSICKNDNKCGVNEDKCRSPEDEDSKEKKSCGGCTRKVGENTNQYKLRILGITIGSVEATFSTRYLKMLAQAKRQNPEQFEREDEEEEGEEDHDQFGKSNPIRKSFPMSPMCDDD